MMLSDLAQYFSIRIHVAIKLQLHVILNLAVCSIYILSLSRKNTLVERNIILISIHFFESTIVPWILFYLKIGPLICTSRVCPPVLYVSYLLNISFIRESWINCWTTINIPIILLPKHLVLITLCILIFRSGYFINGSPQIVSAIFEFVLKLIAPLNTNWNYSISIWPRRGGQIRIDWTSSSRHRFISLCICMLLNFTSIILLLIELLNRLLICSVYYLNILCYIVWIWSYRKLIIDVEWWFISGRNSFFY